MYLTELIFHTEKTVNDMEAFYGILIPFLGTSLGAACVFFMKKSLSDAVQRSLTGFAAGVMVAASVWSLLIPAIEQSSAMGKLSFLPAFLGFWVGILFLLLLDHVVPHLHAKSGQVEGPKSQLQRTTMMVLAVTLHNIPEGMAVGLAFALAADGESLAGAFALALGIGITALCGMHYLLVMAVTFVLVFGIAKFLQSQLGGLTGDTYGALTECGNVLYLLTLIIGGRFLVLGFYTYYSIFSLF